LVPDNIPALGMQSSPKYSEVIIYRQKWMFNLVEERIFYVAPQINLLSKKVKDPAMLDGAPFLA
jgi:hypothetical protein